eukprot:6367581-Alexandrium_andersonii.AAC.1
MSASLVGSEMCIRDRVGELGSAGPSPPLRIPGRALQAAAFRPAGLMRPLLACFQRAECAMT